MIENAWKGILNPRRVFSPPFHWTEEKITTIQDRTMCTTSTATSGDWMISRRRWGSIVFIMSIMGGCILYQLFFLSTFASTRKFHERGNIVCVRRDANKNVFIVDALPIEWCEFLPHTNPLGKCIEISFYVFIPRKCYTGQFSFAMKTS